jgi:hypothetical protein
MGDGMRVSVRGERHDFWQRDFIPIIGVDGRSGVSVWDSLLPLPQRTDAGHDIT